MKENIEVTNVNNRSDKEFIQRLALASGAFLTGAAGVASVELVIQGNIITGTGLIIISVGGALGTIGQVIRPPHR